MDFFEKPKIFRIKTEKIKINYSNFTIIRPKKQKKRQTQRGLSLI